MKEGIGIMEKLRPIEIKFRGHEPHWVGNGFWVSQYFPRGMNLLERFTPFILMDYNAPFEFPPSDNPRGIGPHPHRGFETVTFAFEGAVEHHDNAGNHGIIYPGDVQWMTAGKGILHKEYHEKEFSKSGGIFHMIQLWVNLPREDKMTEPRYQDLAKEDMGEYILEDNKGRVAIVAGEFKGVKGPAKTFSPINIYTIELENGGSIDFAEPGDYNTGILVLSGDIKINNRESSEKDFILFHNREGDIRIESISEKAKVIVLSGQPIDEPIATGGPFVMNTKEEIATASKDFREGKFGSSDF